jgi:hypothetical protein
LAERGVEVAIASYNPLAFEQRHVFLTVSEPRDLDQVTVAKGCGQTVGELRRQRHGTAGRGDDLVADLRFPNTCSVSESTSQRNPRTRKTAIRGVVIRRDEYLAGAVLLGLGERALAHRPRS